MQFVKFSLFFLFSFNVLGQGQFSSKECLDVNFDSVVKDEKKYFGMINEKFIIKKTGCLIEVSYKHIMETKWIIDVCREPLHIKVQSKSGLSVYKKLDEECGKMENDFCFHTDELKRYVQDEGLVFAPGEKENLKTVHGQVYCSYLLLQRYLDDEVIFSKYKSNFNIFKKSEKCELPVKEQVRVSKPDVEVIIPSTSQPMEKQPKMIEQVDPISSDNKRQF